MSSTRLSETSFVVLGLVEHLQPATPYDIEQLAQASTVNFWTIPHTQIYAECARLAEAGLLSEEREQQGRRRRIYRLTRAGQESLERWRVEPASDLYELRDVATLKLFFGADPHAIAARQLQAHGERLRRYEELQAAMAADAPQGWRLALDCGIGHEREFIRFWSAFVAEGS